MSPTILPEPAMAPIQLFGSGGGVGGTISATGSPKRVTLTGFFVLRTRSMTEREVALNLEIAISSRIFLLHIIEPWSKTTAIIACRGAGILAGHDRILAGIPGPAK